MPVEQIKAQMAQRLGELNRTADRLYARWIRGLKA
jgi:hypothetical protein